VIAGLGFTSFVIGFATKDILNNFLSGILILWQRPFEIGDYLFVGKDQGKVEYIGVRATSLRKDDGELVLIPNGDMYSSALTIRGAGAKRRMTLKFNLGYDVDVGRAKELAYKAASSAGGVVTDPKPNVYVADLAPEGVLVTVNFWLDTNESKPLAVYDRVAVSIMMSLRAAGIELFPPGSMIVQQPKEGVPEEEPQKKKDEL
jgi:small-conductance mechanosensitive channel